MFDQGEYVLTRIELPTELIDGTVQAPMKLNHPPGLMPVSMLKLSETSILVLWFRANVINVPRG